MELEHHTKAIGGDSIVQLPVWDSEYEALEKNGIDIDDGFYPPYNLARKFSAAERRMLDIASDIQKKRVLVVGSGIDKIGIFLAERGNKVTGIDMSERAVSVSNHIAISRGIENRYTASVGDFISYETENRYDIVITHDSLHHMDIRSAVSRIRSLLDDEGIYLGLEPICLMDFLRGLHKILPFHPYPYEEGERELDEADIALMKKTFSSFEGMHFHMLSRESVTYLLYRIGFRDSLAKLGSIDRILMEKIPPLRHLSSYMIIQARK